ncbi:MAG: DUF433 domain-containing protein [Bacteroidales bacterium]|nr:DUF433 domain-containing protein [Bacteroidales bacterium]
MDRQRLNNIIVNPELCHGMPTIGITRYTSDLLSLGMSKNKIIENYPVLEIKGIKTSLSFTLQLSMFKTINRIHCLSKLAATYKNKLNHEAHFNYSCTINSN